MHLTWRLQFLLLLLKKTLHEKFLGYSCSGCSSAAQMANYLAVQLDRKIIAEMPFMSEEGGKLIKLARTAQSGRKIIAIDGCPLDCTRACQGNQCLQRKNHFNFAGFGTKKRQLHEFDMQEANRLLEILQDKITLKDKKVLSIVYSPGS